MSPRRPATIAASLALLSLAGWYALTTLSAFANLAWRSPMFDQWRGYTYYLLHAFPDNVLQLENGHRPVVPALLRVFEAWCCGASQALQIWTGAALASLAVLLTAAVAFRDRTHGWPVRSAMALAMAVGIFWLGYARMLLHGNESVHAYLVVSCVLGAGLLAHRAARSGSVWSVLAAAGLCTVAMFSFGPGVASFAAVALVLIVRGAPWRLLLPLLAVLAAALVLYLFVLPGDQGVRNQLLLRPLDSAWVALQWLGSPWANGWLFAWPGAGPDWMSEGIEGRGAGGGLLRWSAGLALAPLGGAGGTATLAALLGAAGVGAWGWCTVRLWRHRLHMRAIQALALAASAFALATASLIGLARLPLFTAHPGQVFADRYLVWSTLFWAALAILLLSMLPARPGAWRRSVLAVGGVAALAALLLPTHGLLAGWAAVVNRHSEMAIVGAWMDVRGPLFPDGADARLADVEATLAAMRDRDLGPFADPPPVHPGSRADIDTALACAPPAQVDGWQEPDGRAVVRLQGECPAASEGHPAWLVIVDHEGLVHGLARRVPGGDALRLGPAPRNAYEGLVIGDAPADAYRVVVPVRW